MRKLVILGGGYGGIKLLSGLLGFSLPSDVEIIVIDKNPYHSYKTEFHTIVAGTEAEKNVRADFPVHDQVRYEFGEVKKVNIETKKFTSEIKVLLSLMTI